MNKCSGSCNNINNPYAKSYVPDVVKDINAKVVNVMSRANERRLVNLDCKNGNVDCKCL